MKSLQEYTVVIRPDDDNTVVANFLLNQTNFKKNQQIFS